MHGQCQVVAVDRFGRPGVGARADPQPQPVGRLPVEPLLHLAQRTDGAGRIGEGEERAVALGLDHHAAVRGGHLLDLGMQRGHRFGVRLAVLGESKSAAHDVGERERHLARREHLRHVESVAQVLPPGVGQVAVTLAGLTSHTSHSVTHR